jgi:hypothetical protein
VFYSQSIQFHQNRAVFYFLVLYHSIDLLQDGGGGHLGIGGYASGFDVFEYGLQLSMPSYNLVKIG